MIAVSRSVLVSAPKESVSLYLRDLKNLGRYEQKVDRIEVRYPDPQSGYYEVQGRFLGLPWRGAFTVRFTKDGGFRSEMVKGPLSRVAGGFALRQVLGGTKITHDEQYVFPWPLRPLSPVIGRWLAHTMDLELRVIKEGAERLHRERQLREIEAQAC